MDVYIIQGLPSSRNPIRKRDSEHQTSIKLAEFLQTNLDYSSIEGIVLKSAQKPDRRFHVGTHYIQLVPEDGAAITYRDLPKLYGEEFAANLIKGIVVTDKPPTTKPIVDSQTLRACYQKNDGFYMELRDGNPVFKLQTNTQDKSYRY